jgi:transcriptional regulator with XRE-family HTH domain
MSNLGNKEIMAQNLQRLMDSRGIDRNRLCADLGFKYTTLTDWLKGNTYPRIDKIEMMANYFGIEKSDLIEDKSDINEPYYIDPEVSEYAQAVKDNPNLRILFDASKDMSKDDIDFVVNMIEGLKKREGK